MSPKKSPISTSDAVPDSVPSTPVRYMTTPEAAIYLRLSQRWLQKLRCTGGGPRFMRRGRKKVVYDIHHLDAWMADGLRSSTSDPGPGEEV